MVHREAVMVIAEDTARAPNKRSSMSVASPAVYSILDAPVLSVLRPYTRNNKPQELPYKAALGACYCWPMKAGLGSSYDRF